MEHQLIVSAAPHTRSSETIDRIMRDVLIALLPATIFGVFNFGLNALLTVILCIASCVGAEYIYEKLTHKEVTVGDYSAAVTGLLLALNLPPSVPFWIPIIGGAFAIVVVKQLYGGLGQNFMNPALAARAFLLISFAGIMTTWQLDGITTATPLGMLSNGLTLANPIGENGMILPSLLDAFLGRIGGCIGETSAIALLIGGIYLLARKVINWRIPVTFILTVFVLAFLLGGGFSLSFAAYQVVTGGLMLGAIFMATDYSSSPVTPIGQWIMGIGCGFLTVIIRFYGGYPEGVSFAIIIMNLFVPLIDKYTIPRAFGEVAR